MDQYSVWSGDDSKYVEPQWALCRSMKTQPGIHFGGNFECRWTYILNINLIIQERTAVFSSKNNAQIIYFLK